MEDRNFDAKLAEILDNVEGLDPENRARIERFARQTASRHEKMRNTLGELQESLDHLRLSVKYLVFDLEATRRENQYLRRLIEANGGDANDAQAG
ncbi:hypothetical protein MNBD_PLANCTO03-1865 [hydrothermal vent metagenome]|uniref:Uncharacterized protein n=1 Tax=hydrothermal vent metagenome TaxID=652676 RepID=A0A3B1DTF0_9ZZZZ